MTKDQSTELTNFYRAWLKWATNKRSALGWFSSSPFRKYGGLCHALEGYSIKHNLNCKELRLEMREQFTNEGLCYIYPFGKANWSNDLCRETMHKSEARLAWVRAHAPVQEVKPSLVKQFKDFVMGIDW